MTSPNDPFWGAFGQAVRIGTELLAALIVGGGLGWLVDTYVVGSGFAGIVLGLFVGLAAGVMNVMRAARRWNE